jgi:dimethylaniline monooxygenase (N-oxide forming)
VAAAGQRALFLDARVRAQIERDGKLRLYRLILPPGVPRLGFVGYNSSIACQLSSELGAHWLAQHFRGAMALPDRAAMEREIDRVLVWLAAVMPDRSAGYFIGPAIVPYADELLRDMGVSPRREKHLLREYLGRVWPSRYATVGAERRRATSDAPARPSRAAAVWRAPHSSHSAVSSAAGA